MGVSSSSHTDQKRRASPEARDTVKGTSLGGRVLYTCQVSWKQRANSADEPWSRTGEHEPGRSREFSRRLVPKAD